jgi:hypothetical protein
MNWNEGMIARAISLQTLARKCVVLVDNCNWTGHECDVLGVTTDLRIIDVEVKISRADLKADAKKDKWWHRHYSGEYEMVEHKWGTSRRAVETKIAIEHPRKVWKHYYALPAEIWKPELLDALPSKSSGILLLKKLDPPHHGITVTCERRATPCKDAYRLKPEQVMDIARLANLRMWEAYNAKQNALDDVAHWREKAREVA